MLTGHSVKHVEITVAGGHHDQLADASVEGHVGENRRLGRIPVMRVVRRCLEIPGHLARIHVDCDQTAGEQIVAVTAALRVGGRGIAGSVQ